jgi:hypothetical protein
VHKLLSGRQLTDKKLYVINKQNVRRAVFFAEQVGGARANRGNQLVGENLGGYQQRAAAVALALVRYRVQQVGFAEGNPAVYHEGVVSWPEALGNSDSSGVRHTVTWAYNEIVKRTIWRRRTCWAGGLFGWAIREEWCFSG